MESVKIRRILFITTYISVILASFIGPRLVVFQPILFIISGFLFLYSLGQMIRLHSIFPEKHDKPSDFPQLITWGPYSMCRHPFYFWTIMNQLSLPLMMGSVVGLIMWALDFIPWIALIKIEERELLSYWGEAYREYMSRVPMFPCPVKLLRRSRHEQ